MSASGYFEMRPAYVGETPLTVTVTVEGEGTLSGAYTGKLYGPNGLEVIGAVTVAIASAVDRTLTVTVAGQSRAGDHRVVVRQDGSGLVVSHGVIELTDPSVA